MTGQRFQGPLGGADERIEGTTCRAPCEDRATIEAGALSLGMRSIVSSKKALTFRANVQSKCRALDSSNVLWTPVAAQKTSPVSEAA